MTRTVTAEDLLDLPQAALHTLARRNGFDPLRFPGRYGAADLAVALADELKRQSPAPGVYTSFATPR